MTRDGDRLVLTTKAASAPASGPIEGVLAVGPGQGFAVTAAPGTVAAIRAAGIDPRGALAVHDSYRALASAGALLLTGPTRTNVNDLRMILVARWVDDGKC